MYAGEPMVHAEESHEIGRMCIAYGSSLGVRCSCRCCTRLRPGQEYQLSGHAWRIHEEHGPMAG